MLKTLLLVSFLVSSALANPAPLGSVRLGARNAAGQLDTLVTTKMKYTGPITPGGEDVELSGTAEDVYNQIVHLNPSYDPAAFGNNATDIAPPLSKRDKSGLICNIGRHAQVGRIWQGISYLKSLPGGGTCGIDAGPAHCVRISCSWDSGIFLCNDNPWPIAPNCAYLATYAEDIVLSCPYSDECQPGAAAFCNEFVNGQRFDTDNYNVIVGWSGC
ncbi:hypothetical protein P152DRAFT_483602 [Eremomyces bilateralis CBS 781.70]|uniref:Uncharacterized protein n=1 Tax=Eremomyces bilateralis CBS 781.70 TaxID=1392243 RepID=A0A6G1FYQ2_9PEZI|nr:uncharacterized protein P152DRAFT_483602 [Eremomyces bilateralis CBS 781.70]KAF1810898.1 hypothetical protein P152DRAFT_483602 [Eremomyces bilateralis CBS 781.70]